MLTLQWYDFTPFFNRLFDLPPDSGGNVPLNEHFDLMGYSSLYLILNFGLLFWTMLIVPVSWVAAVFLNFLSKTGKGHLTHYRQILDRKLFFDY